MRKNSTWMIPSHMERGSVRESESRGEDPTATRESVGFYFVGLR